MPTATDTRTVRSGEVTLLVRTAGDAARPTVVLVHGYPDTQGVWAPVVARCAVANCRGPSTAPAAPDTSCRSACRTARR